MSRRDDTISMRQMLDHARLVIKHTHGTSLNEIVENEVLGMAIIRMIEVVGRSASRVKPETRSQYPGIPWHRLIDTSDRLIREYDMVNIDLIDGAIQHQLPSLVSELERILETETH